MRRILTALTGAALLLGVAAAAAPAHAAPAVPARPASAAVVPPGCVSTDTESAPAYDRYGHYVSTGITGTQSYFYSTSGASVSLDRTFLHATDGHLYRISLHRWQTSGKIFYGPGGDIGAVSTLYWAPYPSLWLTTNAGPVYRMNAYDVNRHSVGVTYLSVPCGH